MSSKPKKIDLTFDQLISSVQNVDYLKFYRTYSRILPTLSAKLQLLLLEGVADNSKTACELSEHPSSDHFVDVNKTIQCPSLDISGEFYTVPNSTPAKPLPSMLNFGGFFFGGRIAA